MPRLGLLSFIALTVCLTLGPNSALAIEPAKPLKVCVLSGCDTYHSAKSLPPFIEFLEANYNVRCTLVAKQSADDLPGLEALDDCDVAFVFIKRMKLSGDQLARFKKYATSGRPIVAVRTASHAVQTWLEFDKLVLGGNYQSHHQVGPVTKITATKIAVKPVDLQHSVTTLHPILAGVELTSAADSLYKNSGHAADIEVLLEGTIPDQPTEPLAWTREYKGGRIFYTSLGAEETFALPAFRKMLANALFWTAQREPESNLTAKPAAATK